MFQELIQAFILIFIAEMGDKTQILAMAFATKYPVKKVLVGIFIGSLLNHGMAVIFGSYMSTIIPIEFIQIIAGVAFVIFAFWSLKVDYGEEEEEQKQNKYGAIVTVAIAFFIGELGDKTQLTAITLATEATFPVFILAGTVLGMIATGGLGIYVGQKIGDRIPDIVMKLIASGIFMFFGTMKLATSLPASYLTTQHILLYIFTMLLVTIMMLRPIYLHYKNKDQTLFANKSRELYEYYHQMSDKVERLCLGESRCGKCNGERCLVGNTKIMIGNLMKVEKGQESTMIEQTLTINGKEYDKDLAMECLIDTIIFMRDHKGYDDKKLNKIRRNFERIIFDSEIDYEKSYHQYEVRLKKLAKDKGIKIPDSI